MPAGRPTDYTEALADEICDHIAAGKTLTSWCKQEGRPDMATVFRWLDKHGKFRDNYVRSRTLQAETWEDEIVDIADEDTSERVAVRINTRQWVMSRRVPKKYSERRINEVGGIGGGPVTTAIVPAEVENDLSGYIDGIRSEYHKPGSEPAGGMDKAED